MPRSSGGTATPKAIVVFALQPFWPITARIFISLVQQSYTRSGTDASYLTSWQSAATGHPSEDTLQFRRSGRPKCRQDQAQPGARKLLSAESFRRLRQFRIVHFRQCVGAETEELLERGNELVLSSPCRSPQLWERGRRRPHCTADDSFRPCGCRTLPPTACRGLCTHP